MIHKITVTLDKKLVNGTSLVDIIPLSTELVNSKSIVMPTQNSFLTVTNKQGEKIFGMVYRVDNEITNKKQNTTIYLTSVPGKLHA